MKMFFLLAACCLIALAGCQKKEASAAKTTNAGAAGGNPLTAPVDYLGAVAQAKKAATKQIDLASLNNAIQLFNAQEERFPKDLNELVANRYLASLPTPPPGMRLAYNPQTGEVKILRQ